MPREIEESLTALRADTAEVLERLDFVERALIQRDLPPGAPNPVLPPVMRGPETSSGRMRTPV